MPGVEFCLELLDVDLVEVEGLAGCGVDVGCEGLFDGWECKWLTLIGI